MPTQHHRAVQSADERHNFGDHRITEPALGPDNGSTHTGNTCAIFTLDATGKGQGAILNENVSVNGGTNPAAKRSVVALYGTGGGPLTTDPLPPLTLPVSVTIAGQNAEVLYAGIAPGLVEGAIQINVRIPTDAPSGAAVILQVGDQRSRPDVSLAIQ